MTNVKFNIIHRTHRTDDITRIYTDVARVTKKTRVCVWLLVTNIRQNLRSWSSDADSRFCRIDVNTHNDPEKKSKVMVDKRLFF